MQKIDQNTYKETQMIKKQTKRKQRETQRVGCLIPTECLVWLFCAQGSIMS